MLVHKVSPLRLPRQPSWPVSSPPSASKSASPFSCFCPRSSNFPSASSPPSTWVSSPSYWYRPLNSQSQDAALPLSRDQLSAIVRESRARIVITVDGFWVGHELQTTKQQLDEAIEDIHVCPPPSR